jgi:hypothetical protein
MLVGTVQQFAYHADVTRAGFVKEMEEIMKQLVTGCNNVLAPEREVYRLFLQYIGQHPHLPPVPDSAQLLPGFLHAAFAMHSLATPCPTNTSTPPKVAHALLQVLEAGISAIPGNMQLMYSVTMSPAMYAPASWLSYRITLARSE